MKQTLTFLIIDKDKDRAQSLSVKIQALGYVTRVFSSLSALSMNKQEVDKLIVIIEEETLSCVRKKEKKYLLDLTRGQISVYIMTSHRPNSPQFFEDGLSGFVESPLEAKNLMNLVRKSTLPKSVLWQATPAFVPVDRLSLIAQSIDDLLNHKKIKFGQSGLSMKLEKVYQVGDRIHFSISFKKDNVAYMVEGLIAVKWSLTNEKWTGFEFETLHGSGRLIFIDWLSKNHSHCQIPLPTVA